MKNTNIRKTNEEFIAEALQKHGNRYNYSSVKYIANKKNVEIICDIHGSFFQTPKSHLKGAGCLKCKFSI